MPLRYSEGKALMRALSPAAKQWPDFRPISPLWLAEGTAPKFVDWPMVLPSEHDLGLPVSATFSHVIQLYRDLIFRLVQDPVTAQLPESWLRTYMLHADFLRQLTRHNQAETEIVERLFDSSAVKLESSSLLAVKLRSLYKASPGVSPLSPRSWEERNISLQALTEVTQQGNIATMQSEIAKMIERLKQATSPRGKKADLARFMDIDPPRVSEWLSGSRQPSGETTLRLLHWVEQQEAQQKKSAGSASTPPAPKTQPKVANEKKPKSSP